MESLENHHTGQDEALTEKASQVWALWLCEDQMHPFSADAKAVKILAEEYINELNHEELGQLYSRLRTRLRKDSSIRIGARLLNIALKMRTIKKDDPR